MVASLEPRAEEMNRCLRANLADSTLPVPETVHAQAVISLQKLRTHSSWLPATSNNRNNNNNKKI